VGNICGRWMVGLDDHSGLFLTGSMILRFSAPGLGQL